MANLQTLPNRRKHGDVAANDAELQREEDEVARLELQARRLLAEAKIAEAQRRLDRARGAKA